MMPNRPLFAALIALSAAPLLLALTLPALSSHNPKTLTTPQQVADTLDSIVQPRFQKNAGRFGVDRVFLEGHDDTYSVAGENSGERRKFRQVTDASRPYVIAFLHCVHKPGRYLRTNKYGYGAEAPSVQLLTVVTTTDDGCGKISDWGDANLTKAVLPELAALRRGNGIDKDFGNWRIVLRPVRAEQSSCLGCHAGAKHGDTLGVMVYAVDKNTVHAPLSSSIVGEP